MTKRKRLMKTFEAKDEFGKVYRLRVWTEFMVVKAFGEPEKEIETVSSIVTQKNERVNRIEKGVYSLVSPAIRLTSDDPNAP